MKRCVMKRFYPHYIPLYIYTYPPVCMWWHVKDFTTFTKHMVKWDVIGEWWRSHGDWLVLLLAFWQKTPDDEFHSSQATDGQSIGWPGYDPLASSTIIDPAVNGFTHLMYFVKKKSVESLIGNRWIMIRLWLIWLLIFTHLLIGNIDWGTMGHGIGHGFFMGDIVGHPTRNLPENDQFQLFFCL